MCSWSHLQRSQRSISPLSVIQRLQIRHFSSPPPLPQPGTALSVTGQHRRTNFQQNSNGLRHFIRWVSMMISGSGIGLAIYWNSADSFSCFADLLTAAAEVTVEGHPSNPRFLFGDGFRRKVFFNYEKRIRMRSPPEKVFEYFSSSQSDGEVLMTPADLMRAVVPVFPPSESHLVRDGYLRGERNPGDLRCAPSKFFMLFDVNNDGFISFKEYIFFVTLLSIPESSFLVAFKMFDLDCNGEIDREEFKKVMALMRAHNRQGALHSDGLRARIRVGVGSVENGGLVEYFFGKDGKKCLRHDDFVQFLRDLHDEKLCSHSPSPAIADAHLHRCDPSSETLIVVDQISHRYYRFGICRPCSDLGWYPPTLPPLFRSSLSSQC